MMKTTFAIFIFLCIEVALFKFYPLIFWVLNIVLALRLIHEILKFPNINSKYSLLRRIQRLYSKNMDFLNSENELLKEEITGLENEIRKLKTRQESYLLTNEEKLVEAEFLLKKQDRQKKLLEFIGHDLKAPLQNITTFLNKNKSPSSINFIQKNANHGLDLIDHLLTNKKSLPEDLSSKSKYIFIPEVVNKLVEQFGLSEYTTTQFKNEIDVIPVQKDGTISIFQQALSNLLSNINKYAIDPSKSFSENQVVLTFDHGKTLGDIHVQVQDSGKKVINESILKNPAKKTDKGHGVGLYQLKRHLEQLGGDIYLEKSKEVPISHFSCLF